MSYYNETNLKISGTSGMQFEFSIFGALSIGGSQTQLYIENLKSGARTTLSGHFNSLGVGKSLGGFKFGGVSGSLKEFPSDGSRIYRGINRKGHKELTAKDLLKPAMIVTGNIGSLTAGSAGLVIWRGSCEEYWSDLEKMCDCIKGNILSVAKGTRFQRMLSNAIAVSAFGGLEKSSNPVGIGVSVFEGHFYSATITKK